MINNYSSILGLWSTKQTLPKDAGKESLIKTTLRELLIYVGFLSTVSIST